MSHRNPGFLGPDAVLHNRCQRPVLAPHLLEVTDGELVLGLVRMLVEVDDCLASGFVVDGPPVDRAGFLWDGPMFDLDTPGRGEREPTIRISLDVLGKFR